MFSSSDNSLLRNRFIQVGKLKLNRNVIYLCNRWHALKLSSRVKYATGNGIFIEFTVKSISKQDVCMAESPVFANVKLKLMNFNFANNKFAKTAEREL